MSGQLFTMKFCKNSSYNLTPEGLISSLEKTSEKKFPSANAVIRSNLPSGWANQVKYVCILLRTVALGVYSNEQDSQRDEKRKQDLWRHQLSR